MTSTGIIGSGCQPPTPHLGTRLSGICAQLVNIASAPDPVSLIQLFPKVLYSTCKKGSSSFQVSDEGEAKKGRWAVSGGSTHRQAGGSEAMGAGQ